MSYRSRLYLRRWQKFTETISFRERMLLIGFVSVVVFYVGKTTLGGELGLAREYLASDDQKKRFSGISILLRVGGEDAEDLLAQYIEDSDQDVAVRVIDALGRLRTQKYRGRFEPLMGHHSAFIRQSAVVAMSWYHHEAPEHDKLIHVLNTDKVEAVRATAAKVLGRRHIWRAVPSLLKAMRHKDRRVRLHSSEAIFTMMGTRFPYRADDPPAKRNAQLARIKKLYKDGSAELAHKEYLTRAELTP